MKRGQAAPPPARTLAGAVDLGAGGELTAAQRDALATAFDAERAAREFARLVEAAQIPVRYRVRPAPPAVLSAAEQATWRSALQTLTAAAGSGALVALLGRRGTGKTHLACAALLEVCRAGRAGLYTTAAQLLAEVKATFGDAAPASERAVLRRFGAPALLVVDELGDGAQSDWERRTLTALVDARYGAMKGTVLIANHEAATFVARVADSVASRITDGGAVLVLEWPSLRGRL